MTEVQTAQVEVDISYACDREDGGFMVYSATVVDQQGGVAYDHTCSNPDDHEIYRFLVKYPYRKFVNVNIQQILA